MEIFGIGPLELMVIGLVALLVVGPKKLPELTKTLGQATRSFKVAAQEYQNELHREMEKEASPPKAVAPPTKELDV